MNESSKEPELNLNQLRDDVLAGRPIPESSELSHLSREELHARLHIVNPDLHPELKGKPDPDIQELRRIAQKRQKRQLESPPQE